MGLRFAITRTLPSGAYVGNSIVNFNPTYSGAQPAKGDFLVVNMYLQFGLVTPSPKAPFTSFSDTSGNVYEHVNQNFFSQNSVLPYLGQFSVDTYICPNYNGAPLTGFTIAFGLVPDGYVEQGIFSLSSWQLSDRGQSTVEKTISVATSTPQFNSFSILPNQLVIATYFSGDLSSDLLTASLSPGYTVLNQSSFQVLEEYIARPNVAQSPAINSNDTPKAPWLLTAIIFDITPPSVLTTQTFIDLRPLAIEDDE